MRTFSIVSVACVLLAVGACGDSSSESNGELTSQQDVQQLFQTIMPDLIEALTDLAGELPSSASTTEKGGSATSTVSCPGGGSLGVNLNTGQATLTNCSAGGVTISASLVLSVFSTQGFYTANFRGILMVSGSFTGTVEVTDALIQWTVPANLAATYWQVTVLVNGQIYTLSSGQGALDCPPYAPLTPEPGNGPCDDDSDCQSFSCRNPAENPEEGCTCRHPNTGECPVVDVTPGSVEFQGACDDNGDCSQGFPCIDCICI
ncbi:MAG: hypothetical protein E4H00_10065 [Myxococcales bacterium]|nr:MAG: hypothetical protein E4H00_10065 [Myxococcales bacterium]